MDSLEFPFSLSKRFAMITIHMVRTLSLLFLNEQRD